MEELLPVVIQLLSGAVGGSAAGSALKGKTLGKIGNLVAGGVGGGIGGIVLNLLGSQVGGTDLLTLLTGNGRGIESVLSSLTGGDPAVALASSAGAGGIGGGLLILAISLVQNYLKKNNARK